MTPLRTTTLPRASGFTLIELMLALALMTTLAGIAVPVARTAVDGMQLGIGIREVEQQLQGARLRAVSNNRPILVRLNCPAPGQIRAIEITGVASTDNHANRCDESRFPFPSPKDADPATPALDGPLRRLPLSVAVTGADVQFFPNGTAQQMAGGTLQPIATPLNLIVARAGDTSTISVNGLGKINVQ